MSSHIADISAWTIGPDKFDMRFRAGKVVTPSLEPVIDTAPPDTQVQARPIGDERGDILKKLSKLIEGEQTAKITEALPRYRN